MVITSNGKKQVYTVMRLLFWNTCGLGKKTKRRIVGELTRSHRVDIVCLDETKLRNHSPRQMQDFFHQSETLFT